MLSTIVVCETPPLIATRDGNKKSEVRIEQEQQIVAEKNAGTLDYLLLMGMIHPFLTLLFGAVNPAVYQMTKTLAEKGQSEILTVASILAILSNFGMQMYAYQDKGLTANMTTMMVQSALKTKNKLFPMIVGYVTNTALQTLGTPSNYMNVINLISTGDHSMLAGLSAQYISAVITTGAATGLIYTGKLEPVANKLNDWRTSAQNYMSERVMRALNYLGEHEDVLSRYDK